MKALTHPVWIKVKGLLLLLIGATASTLLLLETRSWKVALLLGMAVWGFCRAYFFAFYVIEKYVDSNFRFSGLLAFVRYLCAHSRKIRR